MGYEEGGGERRGEAAAIPSTMCTPHLDELDIRANGDKSRKCWKNFPSVILYLPMFHTSQLSELQAQIDIRSMTVESKMVISRIRSQLKKSTESNCSYDKQVSALGEKLDRAGGAAGSTQPTLLCHRK